MKINYTHTRYPEKCFHTSARPIFSALELRGTNYMCVRERLDDEFKFMSPQRQINKSLCIREENKKAQCRAAAGSLQSIFCIRERNEINSVRKGKKQIKASHKASFIVAIYHQLIELSSSFSSLTRLTSEIN
jgi:hypothetical protein